MQMHLIILGGDLNRTIGKKGLKGYFTLSEKKDRKITKNKNLDFNKKNKNNNYNIDYIIIQQTIRYEQKFQKKFHNTEYNPSDHRPIKIKIEIPDRGGLHFPYFDQKKIGEHLRGKRYNIQNIWDLIEECANIPKEKKIVKFRIPKYQEWDLDFQTQIEDKRCYEAKEYYKFIKHTARVGRIRSGQIANAIEMENYIETDYKMISHEVIKQIIDIQEELIEEDKQNRQWEKKWKINYYELANSVSIKIPVFKEEDKEKLKEKRKENRKNNIHKIVVGNELGDKYKSYNKAVSYDWVMLTDIIELWKRYTREQEQLPDQQRSIDILDIEKLQKTRFTLQMRLIPISKTFPKIPKRNQVRPICVQSHVIKLIEMFYSENLQRKMKYDIGKDQVGIVPGLGTQIHLWQVVKFAKTKAPNKQMIFIDLSNAYNSVNRERLYDILIRRQWMDKLAADFLMTLYDEMYFWDPIQKRKVYVKNGVHQGSLIAPMLFNIYFNELLSEWRTRILIQALHMLNQRKKKIHRQLNQTRTLTYADDIVLLTNGGTSGILMNTLLQTLQDFGMQININKCAYMANKIDQEMEDIGCQRVDQYKYLGVWLNTRGSVIKNYMKTNGQILKTCWRLRILDKLLPLRHIIKLWSVFVKPYFDYISPILWLQSKSIVQKYDILWRKTLRIICIMHRNVNVSKMEDMFGQLPFYGGPTDFLNKQWMILYTRDMWQEYTKIYMKNMDSKDGIFGFKDLEEMQNLTYCHG